MLSVPPLVTLNCLLTKVLKPFATPFTLNIEFSPSILMLLFMF